MEACPGRLSILNSYLCRRLAMHRVVGSMAHVLVRVLVVARLVEGGRGYYSIVYAFHSRRPRHGTVNAVVSGQSRLTVCAFLSHGRARACTLVLMNVRAEHVLSCVAEVCFANGAMPPPGAFLFCAVVVVVLPVEVETAREKKQPMFAMLELSTCAVGRRGRQRTAGFRDSSLPRKPAVRSRASPLDRDRAAARGDGWVSASYEKGRSSLSSAQQPPCANLCTCMHACGVGRRGVREKRRWH